MRGRDAVSNPENVDCAECNRRFGQTLKIAGLLK
jgi:hypothetical protein